MRFAVLLLLLLAPAPALAQDCLLAGGKDFCGGQKPGPWTVDPCDEQAARLSRSIAWCNAAGGTWTTTGDCVGETPHTDANVVAHSIAFANQVHNSTSCSLTNDTGYHATYSSFHCLGGGDFYEHGHLSRTARRLSISCDNVAAETISIDKRRPFSCPAGHTSVSVSGVGTLCARTLEDCNDACKLGNPIAPLTGIKVESETDYRHSQGLQFSRNYHSLSFFEPHSTGNGTHSENRLGLMWRSTFDKRVIPILPEHATIKHALTLPSGEVQYFDANGVEQYNYRGGAGTLVPVAGVGYYYLGPDATEFYGTDGRLRTITQRSGYVQTLTYSDGTSGPNGGFVVDAAGNPTSVVLPANLLIRVTDSYGNTLFFSLDAGGRIILVTVPGGDRYHYAYDANDNLVTVTHPDTRVRTYRYNEPANMVGGGSLPNALTSIVDENGSDFARFEYDAAANRAVSTERAGAAQRYEIAYAAGTSTVTDPLGTVRTFGSSNVSGIARYTGASQAGGAGYGTGVKERSYDSLGNLVSQTDFNDHKTCFAYLAGRNLETVRVEGLPAATSCASVLPSGAALPAGSRKIETEWHARWRAPLRVSEPLRRTTYAYNGDGASCAPASAVIEDGGGSLTPIGVLCTRSMQATSDADGGLGFGAAPVGAAREWSYTYNENGSVLSMNGPRTDVGDITTYTYYANDDPDLGKRGNLATVTNALGHLTEITAYNAHGQPLTIVDPNGLLTNLLYDERQRLTSRNVGGELTSYEYDGVGQLKRVTLPDGSFLAYTYDPAHRLTVITDALGNRISYSLDAMGNRTQEQVLDPLGALAQTRSRVFNSLNRLFQEIGAQNQTTQYGYDNQGNVTSIDGPLAGTVDVTGNQYDALNRLVRVTAPASGQVNYGYNALDQLTSVTDPRNLDTTYSYNGLGDLNQQVSPDTRTTTNTYDSAGNLARSTDAKEQVTTYTYDTLNRVTSITFHDGSKQTYAYDQGMNGLGRLSSITETDPANQITSVIAYAYDSHGRVTSETRTLGGQSYVTAYSYDSFGRMSGMTYPSGRAVAYGFDAVGRVNQVSTTKPGDSPEVVVQNVSYHPFGGVTGYSFGNGQVYSRNVDQDGRIASYMLRGTQYNIGYDPASRISFIAENGNPSNVNDYGYDSLDRLTQAILPFVSYGYSYDAVGNRSTKTAGANTETYAYSATSNRIVSVTPSSGPIRSFSFDATGSTLADGLNSYAYDVRGRMVQTTSSLGVTNYQVNALGQRIRKTNSQTDRVFHYDTRGRLIAETDPGGGVKRELLYLGDIPVGVVQ